MSYWFTYREGRLGASEEPDWMGPEGFDKAAWSAGFHKNQDCGDGAACYSVAIYGHKDRPHWLFVLGGDPGHVVEVEGFADYLEFLAKVAPVATVGLLSDLYHDTEREIARLRAEGP
jgi:hypothetical protein